jgi:GTPase SAR1 family protein
MSYRYEAIHSGAEFESKVVQIDDNYRVRLQIWDTAGQETFRSIVKSFYRNSAAILLVYNITKFSFSNSDANPSRTCKSGTDRQERAHLRRRCSF